MWSWRIAFKRTCLIAAAFIYTSLLHSPSLMAAETSDPFTLEEVKSAFLLNFGRFIEWPVSSQKSANRFYICIIGEDPLGKKFDKMIQDQKVKERALEIVRLTPQSTTSGCQIAYLNLGTDKETTEVILHMKSTPTLTVGDRANFLKSGGIIQLLVEGERVRLKISLGAAKNSGLTISSKLLAIAEVVE